MYMMIFCIYFNYTRAIWNLSINNNNNNNYRNVFCELLDTRIFGLVFEGSWC